MASISELLAQARNVLVDSDSATSDAEILLCHALGRERTYLYTWPEKAVDDEAEKVFLELLASRARGTPVAYLTGRREFWSLDFKVTPDTLIPRPETELLVEHILSQFSNEPLDVLDLGTGSGAIAIALGHSRPSWNITACDISSACIKIAAENATRNQVNNVRFLQSDWLQQLANQRFDLIVSNPPYVAGNDTHLSQGDVRFEPASALVSGNDGMDAIRYLCEQVQHALKHGGWFFSEHGYDQKTAIRDCLQQHGFSDIVQLDDHGGQPRVSGGQLN